MDIAIWLDDEYERVEDILQDVLAHGSPSTEEVSAILLAMHAWVCAQFTEPICRPVEGVEGCGPQWD